MTDKDKAEKAKRIYDDMLALCNVLEHMRHDAWLLMSDKNAALWRSRNIATELGDLSDQVEAARNWCEELMQ